MSLGDAMMRRIRVAFAVVATGVAAAAIGEAQAQSWPTKPLRAFIPFAAGNRRRLAIAVDTS